MTARRIAHGCALVLLALVLLTSGASANTITTVAGGGALTPLDYSHGGATDPLTQTLAHPTGIAWSGSPGGLYYVVSGDGTCTQLWHEPESGDTAADGSDFGLAIEGGTWHNCGVQIGGYPTPVEARLARLDNPCCVASNWQWDAHDPLTGPLVASTGSGHVNFYDWPDNTGVTKAGSTKPPDCNSLALNPVGMDDNGQLAAPVAPTDAQFCTVDALAQQFTPPYNYAIAEQSRGKYSGVIYLIATQVDPDQVIPLSRGLVGPTSVAGLGFDRSGLRLIVSDGIKTVYTLGLGTGVFVTVAGQPEGQPGFSGDGGHGSSAELAAPHGVTMGFDNSLYIADTDNCRIRKIDQVTNAATTVITTVAGNGCNAAAPLGDGGDATGASLDHPVGVAIAPQGLLITDTGHNVVRLIDRTTIVGAPALTADNTPTFNISSLDTPSHILCKVDNADVGCGSIGPLSDGPHTLNAWENGDVANAPDPRDPTPAVANFTVDTHGPTGVALSSPAPDAAGVPVDTDFTWTAGTDAPAGIDHYELWIRGSRDRDVPTSACANGTCVAKSAQPLASGSNTWQIRAVDKLGNSTPTETRSLSAGGPPRAAFTISPNPALAGRSITFDAGTSSDESGIARYEWDLDGDGSFETDAGGSPTTTRVYPTPTSVTIRLLVTDGTGDQSTTEQTLKVTQAPGAQNLLGLSINSGAQYTNDPNVTLLVKAPPNTSAVLVSNDGGFLAPSTFPIAQTIKWRLDSSGPERLPKTVYARFMLGPIISDNFTDDIILDEIPPVVQSAALLPSKLPETRSGSAAALGKFVVKAKAKDSNSGVGKLQITANKRKPGKLLAYKTKLTVKAATKPKFLRAQDRAGNFSAWKKLH